MSGHQGMGYGDTAVGAAVRFELRKAARHAGHRLSRFRQGIEDASVHFARCQNKGCSANAIYWNDGRFSGVANVVECPWVPPSRRPD